MATTITDDIKFYLVHGFYRHGEMPDWSGDWPVMVALTLEDAIKAIRVLTEQVKNYYSDKSEYFDKSMADCLRLYGRGQEVEYRICVISSDISVAPDWNQCSSHNSIISPEQIKFQL